MNNFKRTTFAVALMMATGVFTLAQAQQVTRGTVDVRLTLEEACSIGAGTVQEGATNNFGVLDFGTHAASIDQTITNGNSSADIDAGILLNVRCNGDNPNFSIRLVDSISSQIAGSSLDGNRKLMNPDVGGAGNNNEIVYRVYSDAARTNVLEDGDFLLEGFTMGEQPSISFYGEADLDGTAVAGVYRDTLNLEITF